MKPRLLPPARWLVRLTLGVAGLVPVFIVLLSTGVRAEPPSVVGRSGSYLRGFVRPAGSEVATYVPFYEAVELHAGRLGVSGLSLHTGFWGLVDFIDLQDRYRATGDVSTLYLSYLAPAEGRLRFLRGLELTAGRQFVSLGPVTLEQLDGAKLHYLHRSGVELGLFGGVPTGTRVISMPWPIDEDRYGYGYNWIMGGRLGFLDLGHLSGGISLAHRRYRGKIADSDLGFDLSYSLLSFIELSGTAAMSLEALRSKEVRAQLSIAPHRRFDVNLGYHYASPDSFLPRSSIFAVFSEEVFQEASIEARWRATRAITFDLGYGRRFYFAKEGSEERNGEDYTDGANRASARATLRFAEEGRVVAELERVEAPDNAANRLRLAIRLPFRLLRRIWSAVVDADCLILDEKLRDATTAFIGGAFLEVPLRSDLRLMAGGTGGVSPLLRREGSFLLRMIWDFEVSSEAVVVQRGRWP